MTRRINRTITVRVTVQFTGMDLESQQEGISALTTFLRDTADGRGEKIW